MAIDDVVGVWYARSPIVWKEMVAFATHSGSCGVTSIDVQQQEAAGGGFQTIFANAAFRPNVSSSLGDYGVAKASTFLTGTLATGLMVRAVVTSVAGTQTGADSQRGVTVQLFYCVSGSY